MRDLTEWLDDEEINPEITGNIAYVGTGGPRFFLTLSPVDPDPHVAFLIVNTEIENRELEWSELLFPPVLGGTLNQLMGLL